MKKTLPSFFFQANQQEIIMKKIGSNGVNKREQNIYEQSFLKIDGIQEINKNSYILQSVLFKKKSLQYSKNFSSDSSSIFTSFYHLYF